MEEWAKITEEPDYAILEEAQKIIKDEEDEDEEALATLELAEKQPEEVTEEEVDEEDDLIEAVDALAKAPDAQVAVTNAQKALTACNAKTGNEKKTCLPVTTKLLKDA